MKKTLLSVILCGAASVAFAQGTVEAPLSVADIIEMGVPDAPTPVVVEGYIVGVVDGTSWPTDISFKAPFQTASNLILADSSTETDPEYCLPVQLPSGNVRTALSPSGHPENLGHKVILTASHEKYFAVNGLKSVTEYQWVGDAPVAPTVPVEQRGTEENPLSVGSYLEYGKDGATVEDCWVEGVIVGYVSGMTMDGAVFGATGEEVSATNILIAASADVTDIEACIPVQLPSGNVRSSLNLKDNPGNLGRTVTLHGNREKYFSVTGLKSVDAFAFDGDPVKPTVPEEQRGTSANPLSVESYLEYGKDGATVEDCWVEGVIVGYVAGKSIDGAVFAATGEEVSSTNILLAASADVTDVAACIPVQLPAGDVRSAINLKDNPDNLGRKVTLHGNREKYFGVTGLKSVDNYAFDGQQVPEDNAIYKGLLVPGGNADDWTLEQGELAEGISYVWNWQEKYGLTASGFVSGTSYATDAWAISPVIDLSGYTNIELSLSQAANKFTGDVKDQISVMVRCPDVNTDAFTPVEFDVMPSGDNWNFVDSKAAINGFDGQRIEIYFHYTSTAESAGTWEIKNLKVTGVKDDSGVEEVLLGADAVRVAGNSIIAPDGSRVFNLNGVVAGFENLPAGIYVVVTPREAVKVVVK